MISRRLFGAHNGREVYLYTLSSDKLAVEVCDFGAALRALRVKTDNGETDVCLGFNSVADYLASDSYCGATVGRVANRIGGGRFELNGVEYSLDKNDGGNCNHGGFDGFDRRLFRAEVRGDVLALYLSSPDGDRGFPGRLDLRVDFSVDGNKLKITYTASAIGADTYFAPTCHAYFNLDGEGSGSALGNVLKIAAEEFLPLTRAHLPTGERRCVSGTAFDFRTDKPLGRDIGQSDSQLLEADGYDHNFIISAHPCASAFSPRTGIRMELDTDLPGLQLYTANYLCAGGGKSGAYNARDAFCLEPQYFPDAVNVPAFPSPLIKAGTTRSNFILYTFFE